MEESEVSALPAAKNSARNPLAEFSPNSCDVKAEARGMMPPASVVEVEVLAVTGEDVIGGSKPK